MENKEFLEMRHVDLFSGIGGFSLALDNIFYDQKITHTFVEYDPFCQAVLRKHWPDAEINGDIRAFIAYAKGERSGREKRNVYKKKRGQEREQVLGTESTDCFILTGGFPCQPFSHAGRRQGTADDRYLWPEMF